MVFKQDSDYYEHFYSDLKPGVHYVPVKADLRDVVDKVKWARKNDEIVKQIGINGRQYAVDHLLPKDIFCYHAVLFQVCSNLCNFCVKLKVKTFCYSVNRNGARSSRRKLHFATEWSWSCSHRLKSELVLVSVYMKNRPKLIPNSKMSYSNAIKITQCHMLQTCQF